MDYAKVYLISVRVGAALFLALVSLVSYTVADHFTHQAWLGIIGIVAVGLAIMPLYSWLLELPERYS